MVTIACLYDTVTTYLSFLPELLPCVCVCVLPELIANTFVTYLVSSAHASCSCTSDHKHTKAFTKTSKEDSKAKHFSQGKFDHSQPEDGSLHEIWIGPSHP